MVINLLVVADFQNNGGSSAEKSNSTLVVDRLFNAGGATIQIKVLEFNFALSQAVIKTTIVFIIDCVYKGEKKGKKQ